MNLGHWSGDIEELFVCFKSLFFVLEFTSIDFINSLNTWENQIEQMRFAITSTAVKSSN